MDTVAVLGLGAMGSRMARKLLQAGYRVQVWNRTPSAAQALADAGARQAQSPRDAAAGAAFVIAMLRDDDASRHVWLDPETGALVGLEPGAVPIESSTLSLEWVRQLGQAIANRGHSLLEAPVAGSRPQAEAGELIYLVGGEETTFRRAEPLLNIMGSALHFVGPVGAGTLAKLCVNTLLGVQVTALAELLGMLDRSGADTARVLKAVAATPVWSPVAQRTATSMLSGSFAPQFPVELMDKDFAYALKVVGSPETAPTIAAAAGIFQEANSRGLGGLNHTSIVQLFVHGLGAGSVNR